MKGKKGQIAQVFFILAMLLVLGILGLIVLKISGLFSSGIINAMNNTPAGVDYNKGIESMNKIRAVSIPAIDQFIFWFFIIGNIGLILGAVKTKFSAAVIFIWILLLLMAIFISSGIVNIYQEFANNPQMLDVSVTQHFTNFIFSRYMPAFICALGGVIILIMYSKSGADNF